MCDQTANTGNNNSYDDLETVNINTEERTELENQINVYTQKIYKNYKKLLIITCSTLLVLFFWEHFFRLNNISFRPTVLLNFVNSYLRVFFNAIGRFGAHISSYLTILNFPEVTKTLRGITNSLFDFFTSGFDFVKGYVTTATTEYVGNTSLIYLGSILLAGAIVYKLYRFYKYTYQKPKSMV